jgi:hypothetical protein
MPENPFGEIGIRLCGMSTITLYRCNERGKAESTASKTFEK